MSYVLLGGIVVLGSFAASVAWRRLFPSPMPPFADVTLDTAYRRRRFSPELAAEWHGIRRGMTVLEVGPAGGYLTEAAARSVGPEGRLVALDVQRPLLEKLRSRLGDGAPALIEADARRLPFRDASFDLVFLSSVLGEIPDKPRAMSEFRRILRARGTLAISEEIIFDPDYVRLPVARRLAGEAGFEPGSYFGRPLRYTQRFLVPGSEASDAGAASRQAAGSGTRGR